MLRLSRPRRRTPTGLTALIDVVFILLFFFMIASRLDQPAALTLLAPGAADPADPTPRVVEAILSPTGLTVAGRGVTLAALVGLSPDRPMVLTVTDPVMLADLVAVLDGLARGGRAGVTVRRAGGP